MTTDKPSAGELADAELIVRMFTFDGCDGKRARKALDLIMSALRAPVAGAEVGDEGSLLSEASKRYPQLGGSHREAFIDGARWAASVLADSYDPEINIKAAAALSTPVAERGGGGAERSLSFQKRVLNWLMECFSNEICRDGTERNHRFLEEALELVQALGCTQSEAHQLVDYVYGRPAGEPAQELGGALVTLSALASCHDMDMDAAGERELVRVWGKIDLIRAKQAAKPKHSPLPCSPTPETGDGSETIGGGE